MKITKLNILAGLAGLCLAYSSPAFAEQEKENTDYAVTARAVTLAEPVNLKIDPEGITHLAPNLGKMSAGMKPVVMNYMILWSSTQPGYNQVEWTVDAPADGVYGVMASVEGAGFQLVVTCNGQKVEAKVTARGWHRVELGDVFLKAGENKVLLGIDAVEVKAGKRMSGFKLSALELAQPAVRASLLKDAVANRQQPEWFKDAGYGLMFQWTNRATPPEGPIKGWEEKVKDFDLDGFVKFVEESGAAYIVWSITWGNQYISAPIKSLDKILAGRTASRDLLGEMTDRLHDKGIKVIFYYHYGYDCMHSVDAPWMKAAGGYKADKSQLYTNLSAILSEIGVRYGDKLDGWWFDGGARYLNCHFDGSSGAEGMLTAPLKELTAASRTGNPGRMVAYNSWIKPRITEYQDYYGGEGHTGFNPAELTDGVFKAGFQHGLQAYVCFIFEKKWGHIEFNSPISKPRYSAEKLTALVKKAQQNHYPLSINMEIYEDGSVSPESVAVLKELKSAIRGN